jgi:MerR family transcriptional regulator, copper efflux regulator
MIIGQVAKLSGVSKDTVRLYTAKRLVESETKQAGSRKYADYMIGTIERIKAIKKVQSLGFTLSEIKLLLDEVQPGCKLTASQLALLHAKQREITEKQGQLGQLASFIEEKIQEHSKGAHLTNKAITKKGRLPL